MTNTSPRVVVNMPLLQAATTNSRVIFSDINYETAAMASNELSYNLKAIGQSLMTILSTYKAQRLFHPTFGSNLEMYLFDPVDELTASNIKNEIIEALTTWEKRVLVTSRSVTVTALFDEEAYFVDIRYAVPELEEESNITFNLAKGDIQ